MLGSPFCVLVVSSAGLVTTHVQTTSHAAGPASPAQQRATNQRSTPSPTIQSAPVTSQGNGSTGLHFTLMTDEVGLGAANGFSSEQNYALMIAGGVAADFNNDGFDDILHLGSNNPNSLFINNTDGTFTNQASDWGIEGPFHSYGASAADFNNDGYIDLFIASFGPADQAPSAGKFMLMQNNGPDINGQWTFTDVAESAGVNRLLQDNNWTEGSGSSWGDYDLDGDLDLMVCAHSSLIAGNRLFRNDGPDIDGIWRFTDATQDAGLEQTGVAGFLPSFIDLNDDRYPELIIIADTGTSKYYINNGDGSFTDATSTCRGIERANAMGIDIADINDDQRLDFFVSNIRYEFPPIGGNILLIQNPDGSFDDQAPASDCHEGYWGWGSLINDFDHDGDKDILETNGFNGFNGDPVTLFLNDGLDNGPLHFTESAAECGINHQGQGRGLVRLDADNDGDIDAMIFNNRQLSAYYRNEIVNPDTVNPDAHWLRIKLDTYARDTLAPQGIGAMVTVNTPDHQYILPIHANPTYCGTSPVEAHIGLAEETTINSVQVAWADGSFTTWTDLSADTILTLTATSHPADLDGSGAVGVGDIELFLERYLARNLSADLTGDSELDYLDISRFISDFRDAMTP